MSTLKPYELELTFTQRLTITAPAPGETLEDFAADIKARLERDLDSFVLEALEAFARDRGRSDPEA